jgi:hypothetical protein
MGMKLSSVLIFYLFSGVFLAPQFVLSETLDATSSPDKAAPDKGLYLCDGVWSTKSCGTPESMLPYQESSYRRDAPEQVRRRTVNKILHPLRTKASEIGHTHRARYDISSVEALCKDALIPITLCIDAAMSEHEKLLNYEIKLREQDLQRKVIENERRQIEAREKAELERIRMQPQFCDPRALGGRNMCGRRGVVGIQPGFRPPRTFPSGHGSSTYRRPSGPHTIPRASPGRRTLSIPRHR